MKKTLSLLTLILLSLFMSCETDHTGDHNPGIDSPGFTLSYDLSRVVTATRATVPMETGEEQINSFYILYFENTGNGDGLFIDAMDVMDSYKGSLGSSGTIKVGFKTGSGLNDHTGYKLLLCANIEDYMPGTNGLDDLIASCSGKTENEVISTLQMDIRGDELQPFTMSNLPMSAAIVKEPGQKNLSAELTRGVSRFDVFCQAAGYELISASVWNASSRSHVWPDAQQQLNTTHTQRHYGVDADNDKHIIGSLYAFPNNITQPAQNDAVTTCLVIGLFNTATGKPEYFRANINASNMGQQLKPNNVYRTTVRGVNGNGADDEISAYHNSNMLLDIDINGWSLDNNGNIQHNGSDILAVPTRQVNLSPMGETRHYNIFTYSEDTNYTLTMDSEGLPAHVTAELSGNELTIHAGEATAPFTNGRITVYFAGMSIDMHIEQGAFDNHYIDDLELDVLTFDFPSGKSSVNIPVNSSGRWTARIYNGDHFTFSPDKPVIEFSGESGDGFRVHTYTANPLMTERHSFVVVSLDDDPRVSRAITLTQKGYIGRPVTIYTRELSVPATGGSTSAITIFANAWPWYAQLIVVSGTQASFDDYSTNTYFTTDAQIVNGLHVYMPANYTDKRRKVLLRTGVVGSGVYDEVEIYQAPYY